MENLEDKVENLEIVVDASNEIIVENCAEMEKGMSELENKHKTEIAHMKADFKKEIEEMSVAMKSSSFEKLPSPISSSTQLHGSGSGGTATDMNVMECASASQVRSGFYPHFQMPSILDDVEPDLREKMRPHVRNSVDPKEKLRPVQLGFCHWWLAENHIQTARKGTAAALREVGIRNKIWSSSWSPDIVGDFEGYLVEKIKLWMRRQKKELLRQGIKRKSDGADD